ncbi:MAG TPA: FAD:protein FMN transferase [Agromyces sp.]|jgi:thiamine biosynthesis lipoprotein ApbE
MSDVALPHSAFAAMGTVVSLRIARSRAPVDGFAAEDAATADVVATFARWAARCSLFDPASELSRINRGELALPDASEDVRRAYAVALEWRTRTGGAFTPHRGDGVIDLNGVVKALAIAEAGATLQRAGFARWGIDAGGDVLVAPGTLGDPEWLIGIADPADRAQLLALFELGRRRLAIATSGSAERGDHIWTVPGAGPTPFVQVSVAAGDILTADVLATAIVSGGHAALDEFTERFDVDVLAVPRDGSLLATPGWPRVARSTEFLSPKSAVAR